MAWTDEEDQCLRNAVARYGVKRWAQIASMLPGRTSKACSHRWRTYLQPGVMHTSTNPFTDWEVAVVKEAHKVLGNNWSAIAKMLPGRTNAAVKNFWYAHKRRCQKTRRSALHQAGVASAGPDGQGGDELADLDDDDDDDDDDLDSDEMLEALDLAEDIEEGGGGGGGGGQEAGGRTGLLEAVALQLGAASGQAWVHLAASQQLQHVSRSNDLSAGEECSSHLSPAGCRSPVPPTWDNLRGPVPPEHRSSCNNSWSGCSTQKVPQLQQQQQQQPFAGLVMPLPASSGAVHPCQQVGQKRRASQLQDQPAVDAVWLTACAAARPSCCSDADTSVPTQLDLLAQGQQQQQQLRPRESHALGSTGSSTQQTARRQAMVHLGVVSSAPAPVPAPLQQPEQVHPAAVLDSASFERLLEAAATTRGVRQPAPDC